MKRHPRLRWWTKWGSMAAVLLILLIWIASYLWSLYYFFPADAVCIRDGSLVLILNEQWVNANGWEVGWSPDGPRYLLPHFRGMRGSYTMRIVWVPLWIPLVVVMLAAVFLFWRDRRRIPSGHCRCGYDLTGNTSGVCPECGERTV